MSSTLLHSQLVIAISCDISHPRQRLISALLHDLQVAYLQSRSGVVGNLEVHRNGPHLVVVLLLHINSRWHAYSIVTLHRGQTEVRAHVVLAHAVELLDLPQQTVLVGDVRHGSQ